VAGRFPLYSDADVRGPVIKALKNAGWDIVRVIDVLPEGANDLPHFERASPSAASSSPTTKTRK